MNGMNENLRGHHPREIMVATLIQRKRLYFSVLEIQGVKQKVKVARIRYCIIMSEFSAPSKYSPKPPQISGTQVLTFSLLSVGNVRENKLSLFTMMKRCERGKTGKKSHFRPRVRLKNFPFTGGVRKREMKEKKRMKGGGPSTKK